MNNPDDIMPYGTYKSGLIDADKSYNLLSSTYPILNLQYILEDFEGNNIPPGHYQIVLSPDRKILYFVESNSIKASVPVAKLVEKIVNDEDERKRIKEKEKTEKKYHNKPRQRPTDHSAIKLQADMEASIDGTNLEHYVLHYKNGNIQATGYILK
jgi:hypothetical protein